MTPTNPNYTDVPKAERVELLRANVPTQLQERAQWVCWNAAKAPRNPKTGRAASSTNPRSWATFEEAVEALERHDHVGVGFVVTDDDPFTCVDLDHCVDPGGVVTDDKQAVIDQLDSYTELSPSGTGVHVWVKGEPPGSRRRIEGTEIYASERYFTVTGDVIRDQPIEERTVQLTELYEETFGNTIAVDFTPERRSSPALSDEEVIERARGARNGEKFARLFDQGDLSEHDGDDSRADMALVQILAFWTQDEEQLDRLFRQSALYRDKWDRQSYRDLTINRALENLTETWQATWLDPDDERRTDVWNAEQLVRLQGENLRHSKAVGWIGWDGSSWRVDHEAAAYRAAIATAKNYYPMAEELDSPEEREALIKHAIRSEGSGRLDAMLKIARMLPEIELHANAFDRVFDRQPHLLPVENGTIDLQTGQLREHRREDFLTKQAPVNYEPDARSELWQRFLDDIFVGDADLIALIQRAVGYCLTGDVSERVFFICHGEGRNGKSTFLETLGSLLGHDYAKSTRPEMLMRQERHSGPNNEVAGLRGHRFVWSVETRDRERLDEGRVKALTGGDRITARLLYREPFTFVPQFKLWLGTNHPPVITESAEAIWDRVRLIPFRRRFTEEEQDKQLKEKLLQELPGILNWALEGCRMWQRDGLGAAPAVQQATAAYRERMDPVGRFLAAVVEDAPGESVGSTDLYRSFERWCETVGEVPMSQRAFSLKVRERYQLVSDSQGLRRFRDCRLRVVVLPAAM